MPLAVNCSSTISIHLFNHYGPAVLLAFIVGSFRKARPEPLRSARQRGELGVLLQPCELDLARRPVPVLFPASWHILKIIVEAL
jgi:hypothetical protein